MQKCPVCKSELLVFFERGLDEDTYKVTVGEKEDADFNLLMKAFFEWVNWMSGSKMEKLRDIIEWVDDHRYNFRVKVASSANAEIWWRGTFKLTVEGIMIEKADYERVII